MWRWGLLPLGRRAGEQHEGREAPLVVGKDTLSCVEGGGAFPEEVPRGFFPILAKITSGVNPVDKGLVPGQVAVAGDPADHQSYLLPGSREESFGEFRVRFREPKFGLTAVTSVLPVVCPFVEDSFVNGLCECFPGERGEWLGSVEFEGCTGIHVTVSFLVPRDAHMAFDPG